ncbi:hypothetical protein [Neobacillus sp. 19]|uniref:hypothetical protein n=1 Tax=Neobacillus sp. 19 TaxID=3394458 RepID=UPI003BF65E4C
MGKFSRVGKNAKLGDGTLIHTHRNSSALFTSTDIDVLKVKQMMCFMEGITHTDFKTQKSGYGGKKTIYKFATRVHERLTEVSNASIEEVINDLDEFDLALWFLDDGSWHKNKHIMHLYSNMLNENQTDLLINKIESLYGIAPRKRIDRKKDGRQFYYLYFSRDLVKRFRPEFKETVINLEIPSMFYKFGGLEYKEAN